MFKRRRWTVLASAPDCAAAQTFGSLERVFNLSGPPVARDSESIVFRFAVGAQNYYVKRYHKTKGVRSWFGFARIRKEAENQLLFKQLRIPAAEVVAYGEEHLFSKTLRGALITLAIENTADLASIAQENPELLQNRRWAGQVIAQVAEITRRLHDYRFCHNDLKWRNILVTLDEEKPLVYLIDCPVGQRWPALLLQRRIIKDLACLDKVAKYQLSQTQRLLFFKKYLRRKRLNAADKRMIRKIVVYFQGRE
jgi:tRNA A-37 threonylcarbamoyl transferase component Bud32